MAQRAQQWGPKGVRCNTVAPGPIYIEGGAWNNIKDNATALYERDRDWHPTKRMGTAEEVARVVTFLASPGRQLGQRDYRSGGRRIYPRC